MTPEIKKSNEKKLVGKSLTMSYADYTIAELWGSFMPRLREITNNLSNDLISLAVYHTTHFADFKPTNEFERWATVEVADFDLVPAGMQTFLLKEGLYAVFTYQGDSKGIANFYKDIFESWLPNAGYAVDERPHFEILGDKYKNNDPSSEEEIWIPVRPQ